jgi:hypothetical protein
VRSTVRYDYDTSGFQPVAGAKPSALVAAHPGGRYVALHVPSSPLNRAAIWEVATGRLVWAPEETVALAWTPDGEESVLVRYRYAPAPDHAAAIASVLQSELGWIWERRTWPGASRVCSCPLSLPTGWFDDIVVSPRGDVAAVYWQEQDCAGFELVSVDPAGDHQLVGAGGRVETNWASAPVFSPDGAAIVLACGRGEVWWTEQPCADDGAESEGGRFVAGAVVVFDRCGWGRRALSVEAEVPAGWRPDDPESGGALLLPQPEFVSDTAFIVRLPTGERRTYAVAP